ncbi:hypothetical protein JD844_026978 [Phrynosoma platyrhinos]|uniref:Uncharacterized protein n=1 Tax=Phrynosoma platyrhinos TaxID=52577 RepID=A0ABQ7SFK4_PHRPL|nr:hypothetical protein JD844_026978 [Phrynosoma platyrhinos]
MTVIEENRPFAQQLSNVYFTILSLFCFKLFVKISLAILSHFYIVKGNRKEAARIAAEFYGIPQAQGGGKPVKIMSKNTAAVRTCTKQNLSKRSLERIGECPPKRKASWGILTSQG